MRFVLQCFYFNKGAFAFKFPEFYEKIPKNIVFFFFFFFSNISSRKLNNLKINYQEECIQSSFFVFPVSFSSSTSFPPFSLLLSLVECNNKPLNLSFIQSSSFIYFFRSFVLSSLFSPSSSYCCHSPVLFFLFLLLPLSLSLLLSPTSHILPFSPSFT